MRAVSSLDVRVYSTSDEVRVLKTIRPSRPRDLYSVSTSAISSTVYWRKQLSIFSSSTLHRQPAQNTDKVQIAYLDTHDDHLWWLQRVQQYTHEDRKFRHHWAQDISEDCQSSLKELAANKVQRFRNPSQQIVEFQKLWRRFCRLSKNH